MTAQANRDESAVARHDRMVREEREQTEAVASAQPAGDFWQGLAGRFRPAEGERDAADLDALVAMIAPDDIAIDVGAGGGRLALPLTARCREVIAVEPSEAMRAVLAEEAARRSIANLRIVPERWEEADVPRAALVFAAHVTYGARAIEPFLRKMDRTAARYAALVAYRDPPQALFAPFWQAAYGTRRLTLPGSDELVAALEELGARPEVTLLPELPLRPLGPPDAALVELRHRLFAAPDSPADLRLRAALPELTEERDGVLWPRGAPPRHRTLIRWQPGSMA